jgi:hypothetical protein
MQVQVSVRLSAHVSMCARAHKCPCARVDARVYAGASVRIGLLGIAGLACA